MNKTSRRSNVQRLARLSLVCLSLGGVVSLLLDLDQDPRRAAILQAVIWFALLLPLLVSVWRTFGKSMVSACATWSIGCIQLATIISLTNELPGFDQTPLLGSAGLLQGTMIKILLVAFVSGTALLLHSLAKQQSDLERLDAEQPNHLCSELTRISHLSSMGEMMSAIAHEINQPLTAISNAAGATSIRIELADPIDRKTLQSTLSMIEEQACRAGQILRNLRNLLPKYGPMREEVELDQLLQDAVLLITPEAQLREIDLQLGVCEKETMTCVDGLQIQHVVVNLVRNAMDAVSHREANRKIVASLRYENSHILLEVSDNGPGLEGAAKDEIFEPFYTTKQDRFGLGLGVSRTIVENHGGKLWVESDAKTGSSFFVRIPKINIPSVDEFISIPSLS